MTDTIDLARKMRGPDGTGRVMVLDIERSSHQYHVYLRDRASRHAYYLRPPEGMDAYDLKGILDEAGGEEELGFRYWVYPELDTDLKPLLGADPFAGKYFERDEARRFLQIEGERPVGRHAIAQLLEGLKLPFDPEDFPRINEFVLQSFKLASHGGQDELVLLRKDGDRNELRKAEPGFHLAVAEHGLAREIDVHRPVLAETEPALILTSNEHTTETGHRFLADVAGYFGSEAYAEQAEATRDESPEDAPIHASGFIPRELIAPRIEPPKVDGPKLLARAAAAMKEQFAGMKLLRKREATLSGPQIIVRFPGLMGFGKGPSEGEIKELRSIYIATKGDPSFGSDWRAYYQVDSGTGELRVVASFDANPPAGWTSLRS